MNGSLFVAIRAHRNRAGLGLMSLALVISALSCGVIESAPQESAPQPQPAAGPESQPAQEPVPAPGLPPDGPIKTIVYYFHGTVRCQTCLDIERYARETVFDNFSMQLREGLIEWRAVNYDVPENHHFSTDFQLPHPALVLVRQQAGFPRQWRLLADTWELVENPDALKDYVREAIRVSAAQS